MAGKWTTKPNELVAQQSPEGDLDASVPFYREGVLQFTQHIHIEDGQIRVEFRKASGMTGIHGFEAWSDF